MGQVQKMKGCVGLMFCCNNIAKVFSVLIWSPPQTLHFSKHSSRTKSTFSFNLNNLFMNVVAPQLQETNNHHRLPVDTTCLEGLNGSLHVYTELVT